MHKYFLWSSCPTFADVSGLQAAFYPFKYFILECTHFCLIKQILLPSSGIQRSTTCRIVFQQIRLSKTQNPAFTFNFHYEFYFSNNVKFYNRLLLIRCLCLCLLFLKSLQLVNHLSFFQGSKFGMICPG